MDEIQTPDTPDTPDTTEVTTKKSLKERLLAFRENHPYATRIGKEASFGAAYAAGAIALVAAAVALGGRNSDEDDSDEDFEDE